MRGAGLSCAVFWVLLGAAAVAASWPATGSVAAESPSERGRTLVELTERRTAVSKTFRRADGRLMTRLFAGPVHYGERGRWREIDSRLETLSAFGATGDAAASLEGFGFRNRANAFKVLFKARAQDRLMRVDAPGLPLDVSLAGSRPVAADVAGSSIAYRDVLGATDLVYTIEPEGVKETILLKDRSAPTRLRFLLTPRDGATVHARRGPGGTYVLQSATGARTVLSAPFATDDPAAARIPSDTRLWRDRADHVTMTVERFAGGYAVELAVDERWFRDEGRRFPVAVDPTLTIQPATKAAEFWEAGYGDGNAASIAIGSHPEYLVPIRGAFQFDLSAVPANASVTGAELGLYETGCMRYAHDGCPQDDLQIDAYRMTAPWTVTSYEGDLRWTGPALDSVAMPGGAGGQGWLRWDVTPAVRDWAGGAAPNHGLLLTEANGAPGGPIVYGATAFEPTLRPKLDITYTTVAVRVDAETLHADGADLRWSRFDPTTGGTFDAYEVHRAAGGDFVPSAATLLARIPSQATTTYSDTTAAPNRTFTYKVVVASAASGPQTVTLPAQGHARKVLRPDPGAGTTTTISNQTGPATCSNRGASGALDVSAGSYVERALLAFDLRDIPAGSEVTDARLTLHARSLPSQPIAVGAHRVTSAWDEGTALFSCSGDGASWAHRTGSVAWNTPGGDHVATAVATTTHGPSDAPGPKAFDVTAAVQTWVSGGAPNHGILVKAADETLRAGAEVSYASDDGNEAERPMLTVDYADGRTAIGPAVEISSPAPGEQLQGTVSVAATASDDRRVDRVEFMVDGAIKQADTEPPYTFAWDTRTSANGNRELTVRATDEAGNARTSGATTVTVANSAPPTTRVTSPSNRYDDLVIADMPALYWRLGESAGAATAIDASGNGRSGTYAGSRSSGQLGLLTGDSDRSVRMLNATTDGRVSAGLAALFATQLTAEAWVSYSALATLGAENRVWSRNWGSAGGWRLAVSRNASGQQRAEFAINKAGVVTTAGATVVPGRLHLAGTYDGATIRLFVNGQQAASATLAGATLSTTAPVYLGQTLAADMTFDDAALYSRAVTADQLRAHYDRGSGQPPAIKGAQTVQATASDDGSVSKVEFYVDGNRFAEDATAPYAGTLETLGTTPVYDGTHVLTTKAYDNHGNVTTSAAVDVAVTNSAGTKYVADIGSTPVPQAIDYDPVAAGQDLHGLDVTVANRSAQPWSTDVVVRPQWVSPDGVPASAGTEVPLGGVAAGAAKTVRVMVAPPELPAGVDKAQYRLEVDAYDRAAQAAFKDKGNKPQENPVIVNKELLTGLGLEKYYQYEGDELGAGMSHLVNVANGNSLVRWTPFSSAGRGLSTVLDLTYNSLEKKSESPVGNNFSLALSGLTRLGNPIDIHPNRADEIAGRANKFVEITDGDGTTHRFVGRQAADGSTYWEEPEGVHLYLRSLGGADPARRWAFTRPDRVTFYYDADGYPTSVEDANGNRLTYTLEATPPGEDPGGPKRRVTRVTDAGGRSYDIAYYTKADAKKPQIRGKIRRITDHSGSALDFQYYEDGNLLRLIQRGGTNADGSFLADRSFVFTYTTSNGEGPALTAAERVDPDPKTPNQSTRLFSVRDPRGRETTFSYLGNGEGQDRWKLASKTDRAGASTAFAYDTINRVTTVTAPLARVSRYGYDVEGKVTSIVNPESQTTTVAWTEDRHVERVTEPNGKFTRYAYNANGYLTDEWDQLDRHTTLEYQDLPVDAGDVAGRWRAARTIPHISQLVLKRTPRGKEWRFGYDENGNPANRGNLTSVRDPEGSLTRHDYNLDGTLRRTTDANGHVTRFPQYDLNGLVAEMVEEMDAATDTTGPSDRVTRFEHDPDGLLLWVQDPLHRDDTGADPREYRTYFDYDSFHRMGRQSTPKSTRFARGTVIWSAAQFDPNDNVVRMLGAHYGEDYAPAKSSVAERSYDAMDRLTESVRPHQPGAPAGDLERTQIDYDDAGRKERVTSPRGVPTPVESDFAVSYAYDRLDRVIRSRRAGNRGDGAEQVRTTHFCFDAVGDLRSVTAPRAELATVECGAAGAPTGTPFTSRIDYNAAHEVTVRTDPNNHQIVFGYDADGNVETIENQQGTVEQREYDGRDKVVKVIQPFEGGSSPRTLTTKLEYDAAGNLRRIISPRAWDASSDKQTFTDYVTTYEYDAADRLTRTVLPRNGGTAQTYEHRRYDANGNVTVTTLPTEAATLDAVAADDKTEMTYLDPGWVRTSKDENPQLEYDYRAEGWQTTRVPSDDDGNPREDRASRIEYFEDGLPHFEYDRAGRPTEFRYDANNNLVFALDKGVENGRQKPIETTLTYNGFDEVATTAHAQEGRDSRHGTFVYDPNGNVLKRSDDRQEGDDPKEPRRHEFTYDPADRLTLHEDFGRRPEASDDRRITSSYLPTGWKDVRTILEHVDGSFRAKQTMRWEYLLNGKIRTQTTRAHRSDGSDEVTESHRLEYVEDGIYVNGHRVVDEFMRKSPKTSANCRTTTCRAVYRYDARDRLIEERNTKGDGSAIDYTLDAAGNVQRQTGGPNGTVTATHAGGQIETQTVFGHTSHFHYDDFGNLDCITGRDDDSLCEQAQGDERDPDVEQDFTYDANDVLLAYDNWLGENKSVDYVNDAFDRPVEEASKQGADPLKTKAFTYVGLTNQVSDEEQYRGDSQTGTLEKLRSYSYGADGERVAMTYENRERGTAPKSYSYGYDAQGSVSQLIADDGTVQASYGYTAYGEPQDALTQENDPDSSTDGTIDQEKETLNPYRYTAKRFNPVSKQLDMGARRFSPTAQSYIQEDRFEGALDDLDLATDPLTQNRYSLAGGNPLSFVEVDGHWPGFVEDAVGAASGAVDDTVDAAGDVGEAAGDVARDTFEASADVTEGALEVAEDAAEGAYEAGKFVVGDDPLEIGLTVALTVGTGGTGLIARTAIKGAIKAGGKALATKGSNTLAKSAAASRGTAGASSARSALTSRGGASAASSGSRGRTSCALNSFAGSTPVLMADGGTKPIRQVRPGERVIATDPRIGRIMRGRVTDVIVGHGAKELVRIKAGGERLTATAGHPFWDETGQRWIEAEDLNVGDRLRDAEGRPARVQALHVVVLADQWVYNLTVAGAHTYHAGRASLLVHNCPVRRQTMREAAEELQRANQNQARVVLNSPGPPGVSGRRATIDLTGRPHGGIRTPHTKKQTLHVNPRTGRGRYDRGSVRGSTWDDLRMVRRFLRARIRR